MIDLVFTLATMLGIVGGAELVRNICRRRLLTPLNAARPVRSPQDPVVDAAELQPGRAAA